MSARTWWHELASEPARTFRGERALSVSLRTVHILAFSVVLGGYVWNIASVRLMPALALSVLSGCALAGVEMYKSLHWLLLGKGLVVLLKLVLLLCLPFVGSAAVPLLLVVVVLASVGAHMPGRFRHYSVLLRRVVRSPPAVSVGP